MKQRKRNPSRLKKKIKKNNSEGHMIENTKSITNGKRIADIILQNQITEIQKLRQTIDEDRKYHNENIGIIKVEMRRIYDKLDIIEEKKVDRLKCQIIESEIKRTIDKNTFYLKLLLGIFSIPIITAIIKLIEYFHK